MKNDPGAIKKNRETVILDAALRVIKQNGFHKARMSDIAKEAGISYGLVYHYFNDKENLFDAILNRWWDGLFGLMEGIREGVYDVQEKLRQIIDYFLDTYQREPELVNIFITEISRSTTNLTSHRLDHFKKSMSLTEKVIAEGQEQQLLRTDIKARYLTFMFLGAVETFLSTMVLVDQKIKGNAQKERPLTERPLDSFLLGD